MTKDARDDIEADIRRAIAVEVEKYYDARRDELNAIDEAKDRRRKIQREVVEMLRRCGLNNTEIGQELGISDVRVGQILRG